MIKTIIMAAGEGTRMKSETSKVLHKLINKEIIKYVKKASDFDNSETIIIGGANKEKLVELFPDIKIVEQKIGEVIPYGTGYAASLALDYIDDNDQVLILNGDIPLIKRESLEKLINYHDETDSSCTILSTLIDRPKGYGRIIRDENNNFIKITEDRDLVIGQENINEINVGIYIFKAQDLRESLSKINSDNDQNELYLTDCIGVLKNQDKKVSAYVSEDCEEFYGINNKYELYQASKILQNRINKAHMINGVIIESPETTFIEEGVEIGIDTVISGFVKIYGNSKIGKSCLIDGSTRIINSTIEDNVRVDNAVIEDCYMEKDSNIGPYSRIRPNSYIGKGVHIGNFVEVKNSKLGEGTKAGHLAYIGDSDLGKDINIGCGVVFVNYDGKFKHRSTIEDGAFIGSNANIVAPVKVEKEGFVAAGSTITEDVSSGELIIERAEQKHITGYVERKKERDKNHKE
ncbi:bifunctional UDP-N-acetylglucosamine diphosphorylase/glucosamine-1-phosphate N-acetyltransferase GlmU [uncultured Anaerococcus sp.]|uniref:bifunctional UDP-N-acetylglucosamine diphosphorylase/glucosamine-1-phosphate N-acetyltransferase GlmU n=1 Tax=uncultured Anaerococcus sp. TaxID=293428 RepID=UPI00288C4EA2|nr:bifunctional UDP-N-acetylglucosamine diphosphorylase/glucosamine-1-phosphate N-acetyltransferase GlmU [uncultured Anaerococcus sp.]